MPGKSLTVHAGGRVSRSGTFDLLRGASRPRRFEDRLRRLEEQVGRLSTSGAPRVGPSREIVLGTRTEPVRIPTLKVETLEQVQPSGEGEATTPIVLISVAHGILYGDGSGNQKVQVMPSQSFLARQAGDITSVPTATNELVGRGGGSLTTFPVAASRIFGRKATGDMVAMTSAETEALLTGLMDIGLSNAKLRRLTTGTTIVSTDYHIIFAGTFAVTLPTTSSINDGKVIWFMHESGTLTVNANTGQTINGATNKIISATDRQWRFWFNATTRRWSANTFNII